MGSINTKRKTEIPPCKLIEDFQPLAAMVLTTDEIKALNAISHYLDVDQASRHTRMDRECFVRSGRFAVRKILFLYSLKSPELFLNGIITRREYLQAPVILHKFSTRLYHLLLDLHLFNLQEIIDYGIHDLKRKRGFGSKCLKEITDKLEARGYGNLLTK